MFKLHVFHKMQHQCHLTEKCQCCEIISLKSFDLLFCPMLMFYWPAHSTTHRQSLSVKGLSEV